MGVAGHAVLSFGAVIARTSRTNREGVWICRPTHAIYCNNFNRFDTMSINTIALISLPGVDLHTQTYKYFHRMYILTCYM